MAAPERMKMGLALGINKGDVANCHGRLGDLAKIGVGSGFQLQTGPTPISLFMMAQAAGDLGTMVRR
jgi:hypothetical protein